MNKDVELLNGECPTPRGHQHTTTSILDSKHINATFLKLYNIKLVECGEYIQVYYYKNYKSKKNSEETKKSDLELVKIDSDNTFNKVSSSKNIKDISKIEMRSIIRSKLECQRIAKSNISDWKTFVTLTFKENVESIDFANKRLKYFIDKVRRVKKDFKYICIPEFQKRGAVHYHLLCNIDINDKKLMFKQEDNKKFVHIKYWNDGFTSVEKIKGDSKKIVGYISKYMTKDIDDRLFNKHRYFYSRNLVTPKESYINLDNNLDKEFYYKKIQDLELIYQNSYINPFDNSKVVFLELIKNNVT